MRAMTNENFVFKYGMAEPYPILYKYKESCNPNKRQAEENRNRIILLLINLRRMKGRGLFLIGTLLLLSEVLFGQDRISVTG